jgi:hypothetical protein
VCRHVAESTLRGGYSSLRNDINTAIAEQEQESKNESGVKGGKEMEGETKERNNGRKMSIYDLRPNISF